MDLYNKTNIFYVLLQLEIDEITDKNIIYKDNKNYCLYITDYNIIYKIDENTLYTDIKKHILKIINKPNKYNKICDICNLKNKKLLICPKCDNKHCFMCHYYTYLGKRKKEVCPKCNFDYSELLKLIDQDTNKQINK